MNKQSMMTIRSLLDADDELTDTERATLEYMVRGEMLPDRGPPYLTVADAAKFFGVSRATIYRLDIPRYRLGRRTLYLRGDIERKLKKEVPYDDETGRRRYV